LWRDKERAEEACDGGRRVCGDGQMLVLRFAGVANRVLVVEVVQAESAMLRIPMAKSELKKRE